MRKSTLQLGQGIGWRSELALAIDRRAAAGELGFVEITHEEHPVERDLAAPVASLISRGLKVIPHGLGLSLGGAERPDRKRLRDLARQAERVKAPLVSEHIAFVRAGGSEAGHLMPVERSRRMLEVLVENVREAMEALPVPLALENIAALVEWPDQEMDEATFLSEVLERTGAMLLLDVENLYANARNHGFDAVSFLDRAPLERIAYVHVAGGVEEAGMFHDTHFHAVHPEVLDLLADLASRAELPGVMLERDDRLEDQAGIIADLDAIGAAWARGREARRGKVIHAK